MNRDHTAFIILLILLIPILLIAPRVTSGDEITSEPYINISNFTIDSDAELVSKASFEGWPGSGSEVDPYIISELVIDGNGSYYGIKIGNITLSLIIRNCTVFNITWTSLYLLSCDSTIVEDCNISGFRYGIEVVQCQDVKILSTEVYGGSYGLIVSGGNGVEIIDCDIMYNPGIGINVNSASSVSIIGNRLRSRNANLITITSSTFIMIEGNDILMDTMDTLLFYIFNCALVGIYDNNLTGGSTSIYIDDTMQVELVGNRINRSIVGVYLIRSVFHASNNVFNDSGFYIVPDTSGYQWLAQSKITSNNTANGKTIHFLRDLEGIDILTKDVGQLILFRVRNISISQITISKVPVGVQIIESDNVTLQTVDISDTYVGIEVNSLTNSTLIDCDISDLGGGMNIYRSDHNEFIDNNLILTDTNEYGGSLSLFYSDHNLIKGNTFFSSKENKTGYGIKLTSSSENLIHNNYFFYNQNTTDEYTKDTFQAIDFFGNNFWNSSKGRGNYWRDWRIPDNNSNGIVDSPYMVGASGAVMPLDHYPLTTCPVVAPPMNVTIDNSDQDDSLIITWEPTVQTNYTYPIQYNVYRSEDNWTFIHYMVLPLFTTKYIDSWVEYGRNYSYYVTVVNQLIESDPSEIVRGRLDLEPPVINITSPLNGTYLNTPYVVVEWEVYENGSGINRTEISIDEGPWINIGFNLSHNFTGLSEGTHVVNIAVMDNASQVSTANVSFHIDLTMPYLNITSPADGALLNSRTVTVVWDSMDIGTGTEAFEVRADCCNWTEADWETGHTFIFQEDGIHGVEVAAIDRAGNRIEVGITFTIDTYLPELTILTPQDGLMSKDGTIKVTWMGGDNGTGLEGYWFKVNDWNWTFMEDKKDKTLWNLYDGVYHIKVRCADLAGNVRIEEVMVTVDGTLPTLRIISPDDGAFISVSPVTIMWNGTDATSGIDHYEIRIGENQWIDVGHDNTYTMVNLEEGQYTFSVRADDRTGNSVTLTTGFTLDQTRPEVTTYAPVGNEVDPDEVISVTFSERMHNPTMQFRVEDIKGSLEWFGNRVIFVPQKNLTYGRTYNITVVGWDVAGNRMDSLIWSFRTTSKGTVQGYIVDKKGDPIQFAWIYVREGNQTRSREDGFFTLKVESGITSIMVEAEGYKKVEVPIQLEPGETYTIDRLVMSREGKSRISAWSCFLWALLVIISLACVAGAAMYINSKRRSEMIDEE